MKRWLLIILLLSMGLAKDITNAVIKQTDITYYGHRLNTYYDMNAMKFASQPYSSQAPVKFHEMMELGHNNVMVESLLEKRDMYQMNDWLYYNLVKNTTDKILKEADPRYRTLLNWYIMARSGYNVKLYADSYKPYLFVYSEETVYDVPYIKHGAGRYINLTYYYDRSSSGLQGLSSVDFYNNEAGMPMKFSMNGLPEILGQDIGSKELSFTYKGVEHKITVKADKRQIAFQRRYPKLDLNVWGNTPVSNAVKESLLPQFGELIKDKSEKEAVRMILSFTRQAFEYKTDMEAYNELNLIFTPEEMLLSPYSDCEDRSILFCYMVKELLGLNTIFLEYPTHISAAVNFSEAQGSSIWYNGAAYTICEPTGPQDQLAIGQIPSLVKDQKYKVIPFN